MHKTLLAVAAAGALLASPAAADPATPQQNLDCVIWSTYRIGATTDDEMRNGLMVATAWFTGLYEGQTGKNIDDAMVTRAAELTTLQIGALEAACVARFADFGERFTAIGQKLGAVGK